MTVATVRHVAPTWLLLAPTAATGRMTLDYCCYYGAHGMHVVSISTYNSDGLSDTSGPLLQPPIVVMGYMASNDRCYY
jgi:hypothetical protein